MSLISTINNLRNRLSAALNENATLKAAASSGQKAQDELDRIKKERAREEEICMKVERALEVLDDESLEQLHAEALKVLDPSTGERAFRTAWNKIKP